MYSMKKTCRNCKGFTCKHNSSKNKKSVKKDPYIFFLNPSGDPKKTKKACFFIMFIPNIWVFPKIMISPNHPFVHRVFHYFHHPFWGVLPLFLVQHPYPYCVQPGIFIDGMIWWGSWWLFHWSQLWKKGLSPVAAKGHGLTPQKKIKMGWFVRHRWTHKDNIVIYSIYGSILNDEIDSWFGGDRSFSNHFLSSNACAVEWFEFGFITASR